MVEEAVNGSPNPLVPVDRSRRRRAPIGSVSPRLLSAQAAAAYTGWPYTTLRDAALRGYLPVVRIPGSRRMWFDRGDLDRAIEAWKERSET